jgi:hypothetical protein
MTAAKAYRLRFSLRTLFIGALLIGSLAGLVIREAIRRHEVQLDRQRITQQLQDAWQRGYPSDTDY